MLMNDDCGESEVGEMFPFLRQQTMHLVDDDRFVVDVTQGKTGPKKSAEYRMRCWRAKGQPAVILATPVSGMPVSFAACKLHNLAVQCFLKHSCKEGVRFYEACASVGNSSGKRCFFYDFIMFGQSERKMAGEVFGKPAPIDWHEFEETVGSRVELD